MSKIFLLIGGFAFALACTSPKENEQKKREQLEESFRAKGELTAEELPCARDARILRNS